VNGLIEFAPYVPEIVRNEVMQQAIAATGQIENQHQREDVWRNLALRLAELGFVQEAISGGEAILDHKRRGEVFANLASYVTEPLRSYTLEQARAATRAIQNVDQLEQQFASLALHLAQLNYSQEALAVVLEIQDPLRRMNAFIDLTELLPETLRSDAQRQALESAQTLQDGFSRLLALVSLAPRLPESLRNDAIQYAFDSVQAISSTRSRVEALIAIASELPEPLRAQTLQQAIATASTIDIEEQRGQAMANLALSSVRLGTFQQALSAAEAIQDSARRVEILHEMLSQLPRPFYDQARSDIESLQTTAGLTKVLAGSQGVQEEKSPSQLLAMALANKKRYERVRTLVEMAPSLPDRWCQEALERALREAQNTLQEGGSQGQKTGLMAHLGEPATRQIMRVVEQTHADEDWLEVLSDLVLRFTDVKQSQVVTYSTRHQNRT
jgi:hypothetical protein